MITSAAFLAIMLVGVPIGLCLCLAGVVYIVVSGNSLLFQSYPLQMFSGVDSYGLIAIPLFILIGEIMNGGGITRRIVEMAMAFVGALRGGLAYVNVLANMFVASILGSATAQVAIRSWCPKWSVRATIRPLRRASLPMPECLARSFRRR
jgi:TRAP-type mannitol/chloroaromatic compound transport system permease large subunit